MSAVCFEHCDEENNSTESEHNQGLTHRTSHFIESDDVADFEAMFYLYTQANPLFGHRIDCKKEISIETSHFDKTLATRILIHDWSDSYKDEMTTEITKAWLSKGPHNIIAVDWPPARNPNYAQPRAAVREVGQGVANIIKCLRKKFGMSMSTLHVIGHGMGAHIAGRAAKIMGNKIKINTIIGLDPACQLFHCDDPFTRLNSKDAQYVEVVHTNGAFFGFSRPIGTADFYVDGGMAQKSCTGPSRDSCSHKLAYTYYAEAITLRNFGTFKCTEYRKAISKNCGEKVSNAPLAGSKNRRNARGTYYVPVLSKPPYGKLDP